MLIRHLTLDHLACVRGYRATNAFFKFLDLDFSATLLILFLSQ